MNKRTTAWALLGTMAMGGLAQGAELPPVIKDLEQGYDFADGKSIDVLGFFLGMKVEEAQAKIKADYPTAMWNGADSTKIATNEHGDQFSFRYFWMDHLELFPADSSYSGQLEVSYTTNVTYTRVVSVKRDIVFSQEPGLAETVDAIVKKYGPPSETDNEADGGRSGQTLSYFWVDGKLEAPNMTGKPSRCFLARGGRYDLANPTHPVGSHQDDHSGCTAILAVVLYAQHSTDRVSGMFQLAVDYRRYVDNALLTDQFIADGLAKSESGPGATPSM